MKILKNLIPVLIGALIFTACSKNDDATTPINMAPNSFDLIEVTNGVNEVDVLPSFSWNTATDPDADAITYTLFLDTEENPTTIAVNNLSGTSFNITERLHLSTQYYWKVGANDGNDNNTQSNTYSFTTRSLNNYDDPVIENAPFSDREGHTTAVFDNKLWVIGGYDGGHENDVWFSSDGSNWIEATPDADFSGRVDHTTVAFDNKLWIIGGFDIDYTNDVWYSEDGVNWLEATPNASFSERANHTTTVFDNKLWVIGGDGGSSKNDVWFSSDGISWTEATPNADFSERFNHTTTIFDSKLWVIGGDDDGDYKNDIWFSTNGIDWSETTSNANFSKRYNHTSVVLDNKLWVISGFDINPKNDAWFFD